MNLALELQLCAIGPGGRAPSSKVPAGLGGAVLADLAMAGRIRVEDGRVEVVDPAPTGDPLLDDVLAALGDPETLAATSLSRLVQGIGIQASPRVSERLRESDAISAGVRTAIKGAQAAAASAIIAAQG